ncbi:MAG TPA: aminotransferase class V-fold PLP-dependent enzyme [Candidatus Baltobacteraceae bacterium]|nr:aminotransferase class V-fold PLP-dependent enzyme [Candidatus Baltobacteraceae bacterium]
MATTMTQPLHREQFPILGTSTYLVSHSMGAAPLGARAALDAYWNDWATDGPEAWERWLPRIGEIADGIGSIIGAQPGSVFLGPNVSVLQAAIATCIDFKGKRNEVVYEALQFPSLTYVWAEWERYGAKTVVVPSSDGMTIPTERIIASISEHTAIAVLSHAYYVSGAIADIRSIQRHCRDVGALLCVDAYQTTGVVPYDVTEWDLDIVTGGSHKWLLGGPGCGWIYIKPTLFERFRPAVTGWMAHAKPFEFEEAPIRFSPSMYRWGTGTPTIPGYLVAAPGHDLIRSVGVKRIREHNVRLTTKLAEMALERNLTVKTPLDPDQRTGWIGIGFDGAERACKALIDQRVFLDYRPGCGIRVSPHFYTSDEEIERFFTMLDRVRSG